MDHQVNPQISLKVSLDVVDYVVALQNIPLCRNLTVNRCEALALTIIVDSQIMDAENSIVRENLFIDRLHQTGIGGHTQKGIRCLHNELHA